MEVLLFQMGTIVSPYKRKDKNYQLEIGNYKIFCVLKTKITKFELKTFCHFINFWMKFWFIILENCTQIV